MIHVLHNSYPEVQGSLGTREQDCETQKKRNFVVRLCLPEIPEAAFMKSHLHEHVLTELACCDNRHAKAEGRDLTRLWTYKRTTNNQGMLGAGEIVSLRGEGAKWLSNTKWSALKMYKKYHMD